MGELEGSRLNRTEWKGIANLYETRASLAVTCPLRAQTFCMRPNPIRPQASQESVWDYPRPPRLEPVTKRIQIISGGETLCDTTNAFRVLETSHPPSYYLPQADINMELLTPSNGSSVCEWKGGARYYVLRANGVAPMRANELEVAWYYPSPTPAFAAIKNHLAFYAGRVVLQDGDGCFVDGVRVTPQPGGFYGGWITPEIVGPFKGGEGSLGW
jgi:uncharacterized protein (DUF427 family)